ncbi:hypothetical protein [Ulvibacter litoralis]|uniref:Lipoprotein n=1 Tax=Ulvibacter litoralis TaxID=227084 RepID=A0A1G7FL04_9FLAO|nr:hypothetical protein [Ulvibacter litoralis]GHC50730.1 hypothetical protein GCM10008083_12890 [Ulvibacter litoralis]SDE76519.1 hypothetical protein SAMN05421855_102620 [Ulvibacter litoralis]
MKFFPLFSCLFVLLFVACNEVNPKGEKEVRAFVIQWNQDHTVVSAPNLKRDYMDVVTYYDTEQTRVEVLKDKNRLFQQFPDYTQRILNNELVITKEGGSYLVTFTKQVRYNGIEADYPSYLSVMIRNGEFKILREGLADTAINREAPIFPNALERNAKNAKRQLFGDFNGDDLSDYASVMAPEIIATPKTNTPKSEKVTCKGECNSVIVFSAEGVAPITIKGAYQSELENLKDLNSDGADEIGFWDIKPTTKSLYVFDATKGILLCDPIVINTAVHKNLKLIDVFKKSGRNKITVTHSAQVNGKWLLQSDVVVLD